MPLSDFITGLQHIGIPTNDLQKTIDFYSGLGFKVAFQTVIAESNVKVAFLRLKNVIIETYQNNEACETPGAIDHLALDVSDIEKVFATIQAGHYTMLDHEIQYLPFWEHGVKFFTIMGPNKEKVEFSQML